MGKQTWRAWTMAVLVPAVLASGCAKDNGGGAAGGDQPPVEKNRKPVTLTLFNAQPGGVDFQKLGMIDAVQAKFPWVTLQEIKRDKDMQYTNWITAQTPVDFIYDSTAFTVSSIMENGLQVDLAPYIKQFQFQTGIFEQNVLTHALSTNSEGKLYGLPFSMNRYGLFYNKDLFDKFGVAYPRDGMSWDEVYDIAKRMTRSDAGTVYKGMAMTPQNILLNNQLSLSPLASDQDKAMMDTDGWKQLLDNMLRFGRLNEDKKVVPNAEALKGTVAMVLGTGIAGPDDAFAWDVASVPEMKEKPKTGFKPASLSLFMSATSTQREETFEVMRYLVSPELQKQLTRKAVGTPLNDTDVQKQFGQDLPQWKGKHVESLYYYPDAPAMPPRKDGLVTVPVDLAKLFTSQEEDTNTILRKFNEQLQQAIEAEKAKQAAQPAK